MIIEAILKLNPTAEVSVSGNDINSIVWENGTTPISKEQILAIIPQVELDMAMETLRAKRNKLLADTDFHSTDKIAHLQMHKLLNGLFIDKH
jgi:hypothetical protein